MLEQFVQENMFYIIVAAIILLCILKAVLQRMIDNRHCPNFIGEKNHFGYYYDDLIDELNEWRTKIVSHAEKHGMSQVYYERFKAEMDEINRIMVIIGRRYKKFVKINMYLRFEHRRKELYRLADDLFHCEKRLQELYYDMKAEYDRYAKTAHKQKQKEQQHQYNRKQPNFQKQPEASVYFSGCHTKKELTTRFRALAKKYHPDNGGDVTLFVKIKAEYDALYEKL